MSTFRDNSWISQHDLLRTDYGMIAFTSTVFAARVIVQAWRRRTFEWQDAWLYIAFIAYVTFSALYVSITPVFFKLEEVLMNPADPSKVWVGMQEDIIFTSRVMWCSGMIYWTCLWCVKYSLMALYKKLLIGLSNAWIWLYWSIIVFSFLAYVGCIVTGPAIACKDTASFLDKGVMCLSSEETRHQTASLYYAFAVDALTNLMVMFLPIRLVWPLQMARSRKIGVCVLFGLGLVCILFSTLRIVQVTSRDGKPRSPDPKWLTMWTIIECSTAVIIGCCPMLAAIIPKPDGTSKRRSYNVHGYERQPTSQSNGSDHTGVKMHQFGSSETKKKHPSSEVSWMDAHGSQEDLAAMQGTAAREEEASRHVSDRRFDNRNVRQLKNKR